MTHVELAVGRRAARRIGAAPLVRWITPVVALAVVAVLILYPIRGRLQKAVADGGAAYRDALEVNDLGRIVATTRCWRWGRSSSRWCSG